MNEATYDRVPRFTEVGRFGRPVYSPSMLGNAAHKILTGRIDEDWLAEKIEQCHWCNVVVGRCWSGQPECWHLAARLLLDQGLRPLPTFGALVGHEAERDSIADQLTIPHEH